jgi:cytochrome c-type protein NapB
MAALVGCHRLLSSESAGESPPATLTSSAVRAERRLYDGAPPIIPHPPLNITCTQCHTDTGMQTLPLGFAPANPHVITKGLGGLSNCQQCHAFRSEETALLNEPNDFVGLQQTFRKADRSYAGAPPVIPHREFMRENCTSCHSGPAARLEIRCTHADRANCRQCHVPTVESDAEAADNLTAISLP